MENKCQGCGINLDEDNMVFVSMISKNERSLSRNHIICTKCGFGVLEALYHRSYINRKVEADEHER